MQYYHRSPKTERTDKIKKKKKEIKNDPIQHHLGKNDDTSPQTVFTDTPTAIISAFKGIPIQKQLSTTAKKKPSA